MSVCINVGTGHTYTLLTYRILSTFLHKPKWSRGISVGVWVACDGALMKHPRSFLLVHVCLHSCTGGLAEAEVCRPAGNCSAAHYLQGPPPPLPLRMSRSKGFKFCVACDICRPFPHGAFWGLNKQLAFSFSNSRLLYFIHSKMTLLNVSLFYYL